MGTISETELSRHYTELLLFDEAQMNVLGTILVAFGYSITAFAVAPIVPLPKPRVFNGNLMHAASQEKDAENPPKKIKPKLTVSKETTFVTEPLDKDGNLDYAAALNKRLGEGVTADNNANVLLCKAMGPTTDAKRMPTQFYKLMGINEPSDKGDYFVELRIYLKATLKVDPSERFEIEQQLQPIFRRPWKAKDFPNAATWLQTIEKPLNLVVEASKRTRYFSPIVPTRTGPENFGLSRAYFFTDVAKERCLQALRTVEQCCVWAKAETTMPGKTCWPVIDWRACLVMVVE